jgi:hypothetical protein
MRYKVEIAEEPRYDVIVDDLPKAKMGAQVNYSLFNKLAAIGGADMRMSEPDRKATKTITKVPREAANLEAEGGETVLTFDPVGYPLFYTIKGPRHHSGGVPLNLPDDSFIFSDTKDMIIRDCTILKMFNKACNKKGFTPAALSKQFDINRYRNILQDPNTDEITRNTAESMIKKYVIKLGALALAQEAKKGFPQGIPIVAKSYMDANGISEDDILPELAEEQAPPMQQGQGQMSPTDQMPPDQYAQEQMPDGMQNVSPDQMDEAQMQQMMMAQQQGQMPQQGGIPEGAATPEMMEGMMGQMEQQAPPMAMYGMSMGGFYPEYAFGGTARFDDGGTTTVTPTTTVRPANTEKVDKKTYDESGWETKTDDKGQYKYNLEKGNVEGRSEYDRKNAPGGGGGGGFKGDLCTDMKTKGRKHYGKTAEEVIAYAFAHLMNQDGTPKTTGWQAKVYQEQLAKLRGCEVKGARGIEKAIYTEGEPPVEDCPVCKDEQGNDVTTGPDGQPFKRVKDAQGNCTPCPTTECYCEDENGNEIVVDCSDPCTKGGGQQQQYYGESIQGQEVPFKSNPDYLVWADANMNPQYIGPRGVQLEQYGKDPRGLANQYSGQANALMQAQQKFIANPGASLAAGLTAQQAAAAGIRGAYDEANKFNTEVRNNEIATNTAYRKDYLDKLPIYGQSYLDNVARKKENDARFFNEKQAKQYEMKKAQEKYDTEMQWLQASNENIKWGGPDRGFYSVKTKDFTPTPTNADAAQRMKDIMSTYGIEDENVAYKLATAARYGGQYANGGFIYTNNIFPYLL